ncbi:MAG: formate dehydrogenase accessory sulfurtransferase FdhD [Eubacterium sp.]
MSIKEEQILKITSKGCKLVFDPIVEEYPVTLYLNEKRMISLMCTPSSLKELAVGFFYLKGMITAFDQISDIKIITKEHGSDLYIESKQPQKPVEKDLFELSEESIVLNHQISEKNQLNQNIEEVLVEYDMTLQRIFETMGTFSKKSELFVNTGGVHSIGLYRKTEPILFYDDVSRYNTYNKLFGGMIMKKIDPKGKMLLTTGRIPSEVMTWIIKNKIRCVLSISAPTHGSVQLARKNGVTLMGFVRENRLNIYA